MAVKDKLVTLEDLKAVYDEITEKLRGMEMWEDVTSELSAWGTGRRLTDLGSYTIGQSTRSGLIQLMEWDDQNERWRYPGTNTGTSGAFGEGSKTRHAYINVSAHQVYRMSAWLHYSIPVTVALYRSDGTPIYALRHAQDAGVLSSAPNSGVAIRGEWNSVSAATAPTSDCTASCAFATGTFVIPKNATRMLVMNYAGVYDQPADDFILERLVK